ncbi:MAG: pirin family protein [Halobacteriota archaeon]
MSQIRRVERSWKSAPTIEGAGVHLKRAFGFQESPELDPFLLLDDFHSRNPTEYLPGFPWHPHRGIETVTYVLQGKVEHGDSMGNQGVIGAGDVQWMTAGSGIIHQEMPEGEPDGRLWGLQLWTNLPGSSKMMTPRYREIKADTIPEVGLDSGARVKVICGTVDGDRGPVQDIVAEPEYLDINMQPHSHLVHRVKDDHTAIAYMLEGTACFDDEDVSSSKAMVGDTFQRETVGSTHGPESVIVWGRKGDMLSIRTKNGGARFILITGRPLREPVAWSGPIVMNTQEELRTAFQEYRNGTFVKE